MEAVEWSEILRWVPGTPKVTHDQEHPRPEYGAGAPDTGQVDAGNRSAQIDAAS
jgi:hypothetical protein